jgi:hypothetical protein
MDCFAPWHGQRFASHASQDRALSFFLPPLHRRPTKDSDVVHCPTRQSTEPARVEESTVIVLIVAIGVKNGNRLLIEAKEYKL